MKGWENYIYIAIFFLILGLLFYIYKLRTRLKQASSRQSYLEETFDLAQKQFAELNLKLHDGGGKAGYSALIDEISGKSLVLDVNGFLSEDWQGKNVDVFFNVHREEGPVFYAFNSLIEKINADYENSRIILKIPDHLRIEKKRHFIRVQPDQEDIRVIGVWKVQPGRRLPASAADMGTPLTHYKPGMEKEDVQVENISGSGLALRFPNASPQLEEEFCVGKQILCLVVYKLEVSEKPIAFWCTGEIMNSRIREGKKPVLVLGLEFTNWAVLEGDSNEIHWAHSSPTRGARPMLQWVDQIEKNAPRQKDK